jgi:hypothetical protein
MVDRFDYWGQVWKKELLLTLIPGEKGVEDTAVSGGGGEVTIPPFSSERHDDIRTARAMCGFGISLLSAKCDLCDREEPFSCHLLNTPSDSDVMLL